jgi:copper chaperone CopZ
MKVIHVPTRGMSCGACSALVERAVSSLDGVYSVTSSDHDAMTSILFDETVAAEATLIEAIAIAGFEPA